MTPGFAQSVRGYLDTPTMGLLPLRSGQRVKEALDAWMHGQAEYESWEQEADACREAFAALLGARAASVALLPSVVPAVSAVADVIARRSGGRRPSPDQGTLVLAHRAEFQSLLLPFLARFGEDRVRWVDGPYVADTFLAGMGPEVSAVIVSSVASHDGGRPDLTRLAGACQGLGAELVVDATQSLGLAGLGVPADQLSVVVAAGYKGLLGLRGAAYAYLRDDLVEQPPLTPSPYGLAGAGSYGPPLAARPGAPGLDQSPAWLSWVGARPGLELLRQIPEAERERHTTSLAALLRAGLEKLDLPVQATDLPSPLVSLGTSSPERAADALRSAGVRCAVRRGRVRFGFHLYNAARDVEHVLSVLASPSLRSSL